MAENRLIIVLFGATGDLAARKLLPALKKLKQNQPFTLLACGRKSSVAALKDEKDGLYYQMADPDDPESFDQLKLRLNQLSGAELSGDEAQAEIKADLIFYLAVPPRAAPGYIQQLFRIGLNTELTGFRRVVLEKPFGVDYKSARQFNLNLKTAFSESQIYRIDHYLGKETVQNLLVFRFANPIFETLLNRTQIKSVQITAAEELGIGNRAAYFDQVGVRRDMLQNHLLQILCLFTMEAPSSFDSSAVRTEKLKVLNSIKPLELEQNEIVLGQYQGYLDEPGVRKDSNCDTFAAARFMINNWRWQGVPFYLRTGKSLKAKTTTITVAFRCPPVSFFGQVCSFHSNLLVITLQPDEGIDVHFQIKGPGSFSELKNQQLRFRYHELGRKIPDSYQSLMAEVIKGDQTLFVHSAEVEAAWKLLENVLDSELPVYSYKRGSWGPIEAERILEFNSGCNNSRCEDARLESWFNFL